MPNSHQSTITESERREVLDYLTEYRRQNGKSPTMAEIKDRFGGVLSVLMIAHYLKAEGRLPGGRG